MDSTDFGSQRPDGSWRCRCNPSQRFRTRHGLEQHWANNDAHHYCQGCQEHFESRQDLTDHFSERHWWCQTCNKLLATEDGLRQHYFKSSRHQRCEACELGLKDRAEEQEHIRQHHLCPVCKKHFRYVKDLDSHSIMHKPRETKCPGKTCLYKGPTLSAVIKHIEQERCDCLLNSELMYILVNLLDAKNVITTNPSLIQYNEDAYFCKQSDDGFGAIDLLQHHLRNSCEWQERYLCIGRNCKGFYPLSSLVEHLENSDCGCQKSTHAVFRLLRKVFAFGGARDIMEVEEVLARDRNAEETGIPIAIVPYARIIGRQ